ncbi:MAG: hopanoid-associated sugar epimerase [Armatimonadota bacterium]
MTGGTGFVGAHVVRKLLERGDDVIALVRLTSDLTLLDSLPVKKVTGDIRDPDSFMDCLEGVEELYHVAADYRLWSRHPIDLYKNNAGGTKNVLEAARIKGVGKIVYTSTVGCLGLPRDGGSGDESTPVTREDMIGHYKRSKFDAEQFALQYASDGLDVVIVNPSTPVGPGDIKPTPTGRIIVDFLRGRMPAYVDTGLNLVAVEDVAEGHLLATEKGLRGEKYILGNENITLRELLAILSEITHKKTPVVRIPHWVAYTAAAASEAAARLRGCQPGISIESVRMSRNKMFFSPLKAVERLGLPQSSVEDALDRAVQWFRDKGFA